MQTHQLQPSHKQKARKIVGRGRKKGTYSGRGGKGQSARSGRKMAPIVRELIKRYPKLKGYRSFVADDASRVINLDTLDQHVKDGDIVTPAFLVTKKAIRAFGSRKTEVKILGRGKIAKKITVEGCAVSSSAKKAIEAAGGTVKS